MHQRRYPFTDTMTALNQQYGQPHQLALQWIAELMDFPSIVNSDGKSPENVCPAWTFLVSMLEQMGGKG